jgi:hypothetical protein
MKRPSGEITIRSKSGMRGRRGSGKREQDEEVGEMEKVIHVSLSPAPSAIMLSYLILILNFHLLFLLLLLFYFTFFCIDFSAEKRARRLDDDGGDGGDGDGGDGDGGGYD